MTNRKLKNVQRNLRIREVICDNAVNLFSAMVCLHTMGESKNRISAMLQEYNDETVPEYEKLAAEDIQHESVVRGLTAIGMEFEQALPDVDALAYKKPKLSYSEQRRLSADMRQ